MQWQLLHSEYGPALRDARGATHGMRLAQVGPLEWGPPVEGGLLLLGAEWLRPFPEVKCRHVGAAPFRWFSFL